MVGPGGSYKNSTVGLKKCANVPPPPPPGQHLLHFPVNELQMPYLTVQYITWQKNILFSNIHLTTMVLQISLTLWYTSIPPFETLDKDFSSYAFSLESERSVNNLFVCCQPRSQGSLLPALRSERGENPGNEVGLLSVRVNYESRVFTP